MSKAIRSATSSPAAGSGVTRSASQVGKTAARCGAEVVLARRLARQVKAEGLKTLATSGRIGSASSASADLQLYLESKLIEQLDTVGSTLFNLTWKEKTTPLGRRYLERAASGLRKEDNGFGGWGLRVPWGSPRSAEAGHSTGNPERAMNGKSRLEDQVFLTSWAQPASRDWRDGRASQETMDRNSRPLNEQAVMLTSSVPGPARLTASGLLLTGCDARMASSGQLDPAHSRWLMGLPEEFCASACTAMESYRKSPQPSSKPTLVKQAK